MKHCALILLMLALCPAVGGAAETPLFRVPLQTPAKMGPWARVVPLARLAGGVLRTATQATWTRSGLRIGPLPLPAGSLIMRYDFRPRAFGPQSQEITSESPSTHWYMLFADGAGRYHLFTHSGGQWAQRRQSDAMLKADTWYRARIVLTRTSIAGSLAERDGGAVLWEFPPTPMDDGGDETAFFLCDEGPDANAGRTEWTGISLATDDPNLKRRMDARARELAAEERARAQQRAVAARLQREGIALLPMPQRVALKPGRFALGQRARVVSSTALSGSAWTVRGVLAERLGRHLAVGGERSNGDIVLAPLHAPVARADRTRQGYRLQVTPRGVSLSACSPEGFFYAAQTLAQLARPVGTLPAVEITDWPAIPERLVMVAVSQGAFQVIDLEYWKRMIRELAAVKVNRIMPYFEGGTFYYERYPFLGLKGRNGFTGEKGRLLSRYAREHCVQIIPQQQSFGHSGSILVNKELAGLGESGDVFCSTRPQVLTFLGHLYDELAAAFPDGKHIHVGGDEFASGFAQCEQCKARAAAIGKPGLYAEYLGKLTRLLAARKRKPMIWWHEEGFTEQAAARLPKGIAVFDWHYGNQSSYPSLKRLQRLGFQAWATPAVTRYYAGQNDFDETFGNIRGFLQAGAAAGVPGECTCTWVHGIWGGRNLFELNYYALLYSGQCAWNPAGDDADDFRWRYARHWFGLAGKDLGRETLHAVHAPYGEPAQQKFWRNSQGLEPLLAATPKETAGQIAEHPELVAEAGELLRLCARANAVLDRWQRGAKRNRVTLDYLRHDVRIHAATARRIRAIAQARDLLARAEDAPPAERRRILAPATAALKEVVGHYDVIERLLRRSVHEAGGGEPGWGPWYPFVTKGGVMFRVKEGRDGIRQLLADLEKADAHALGTFSVRDFGAVPDDSRDDREAVLAAAQAAQEAGGGTVTFPPGKYQLSMLELKSLAHVAFAGAGRDRTVIQRVGAGPHPLIFKECTDLAIRDLAFDANGCLNYGGTYFDACKRVRITDTRYFDSNTAARRQPRERTDIYSYVFGRGQTHHEDLVITRNLIEDLQLEVDYCKRVTITDNVVRRPTSTTGIGTFSLQWNAVPGEDLCGEDILIARNTIEDLSDCYTAIAVHLDPQFHKDGSRLEGVAYRDIRILDNTIIFTPAPGTQAARAIQVGATDSSRETKGVVFDRIRVEGNRIYAPPGAKVLKDAGSEDLFILGNHSRQFSGGPDFLFSNISVRNNTLYSDRKPGTEFVAWFARGANCVIEGNPVRPYEPPPR